MGALPNLYGLGADAVKSFEVSEFAFWVGSLLSRGAHSRCSQILLADGRLVNANVKENADLYRALKGGGSNFGVWHTYRFTWFGG